mgnify:CR=1 FL=1
MIIKSGAIKNVAQSKLFVISLLIALVLGALPFILGTYQTLLLAYGLIFAIAGLGFNLLLGYTGLLSFGHAAFFGVGAYAVAFAARDLGIKNMELLLLTGILSTFFLSVIFGIFCSGLTRIFFAIMCLALSQVVWVLSNKLYSITGGSDGMSVKWPSILWFDEYSGSGAFHRFIFDYYYYVLVIFCIMVTVMWLLCHSPFGKVLQAIRDNETRAQFVGINIKKCRFISFVISGTLTGLAGTLWVPLTGHITPESLHWPFSGEILFLTLLGGFQNFSGPIIGGIAFTYLKAYAVASTPYWQFVLGVALLLIVIAMPRGIVGLFSSLIARFTSRSERG